MFYQLIFTGKFCINHGRCYKVRQSFQTSHYTNVSFQLTTETNHFIVPGLFDSFMKIIKPNEQFTVSILQKGEVKNNTDLISSMESHIVILKAADIKGLRVDRSIDMFNYKANSVILFADWIK